MESSCEKTKRIDARALLEQVAARAVVREDDALQRNALGVVDRLLRFEDILVKEELKLLVRKVDAKLLKRVCFEDLKAEDVENADEAVGESALISELCTFR